MDQLTKEPANPFAVTGRENNALAPRSMMDAEVARGVAEIQGAMVVAKKFPRDNMSAYNAIMRTCDRPSLAERAIYTYPKGDKTVAGPSIRLAEAIAQNWGNIRFAVDEVEQHDGYSIVKAHAWDMETNTYASKTFTVNHSIGKKGGNIKILTDPRDIYELCANQGARRMRACILAVIPGDVIEDAVERCKQTLAKKDGGIPIMERIRKMSAAFEKLGVSTAMIERRFKHKVDVLSEEELVVLRGIYTSVTDGEGKIESYFDAVQESQTPTDLEKKPAATTAAASTSTTAESKKETTPAQNATEASKPSEAPAETTKPKRAKAERKEEPPKEATLPLATTAPAPVEKPAETETTKSVDKPQETPPAPAATPTTTKPIDALRNVMVLQHIKEMEIIELLHRKHGAPPVNSIEDLGEPAIQWVLDRWDVVEGQILIDRKANQ